MKNKNTHTTHKKTPPPNRRSIRLKGYDYTRVGPYYVTICTQNREYLFGNVFGGHMAPNNAGQMIQMIWDELPEYYPGVETDTFQIMPNHVHGIIFIVGAGPRACPKMSLPDVMHRFKSLTTNRYADGVRNAGWLRYPGRLWQRNYYEHIISDEDELNRIRKYIAMNPTTWQTDRLNKKP